MLMLPTTVRIYVARFPVDMRRGHYGLSALVREEMHLCPLSGHLFIFKNKRRDRIKILYWDNDGLVVVYKKLEQGLFHWPLGNEKVFELKSAELACVLEGIELKKTKRHKRFKMPTKK